MKTSKKIGSNTENKADSLDRRICVAPMMDYTDRHCRYFMRLLNPTALLYTEMITSQALLRGDARRLLAFDPFEQPVALQLGGSDPHDLALAARMGEEAGYQEINLNCGCPSDRVKSGNFGACLMAEPERVADSVRAMREAVAIPVTVKCRIGIEPREDQRSDYEFLSHFVMTVAAAGCQVFVVHARNAILTGLSPKENREIPPLRYDVAGRLREDFPQLTLVLNGGVRHVEDVRRHLSQFDGVMIGREAYQNPYLLAQLHQGLIDSKWTLPTRHEVLLRFAGYATRRVQEGDRFSTMIRHIQGLYAGLPRARSWRRYLAELAAQGGPPEMLADSLRIVQNAA